MEEVATVLLADDHPLVRAGVRTILAPEVDIRLVAEAASGEQAQRLCVELQPHVLLLNLSMPGPTPAEVVAYVRTHCPATRIIVLTAYDDDAYVRALVAAGVSGYVLKDEATDAMVHAIRAVVRGSTWFSRGVVQKLIQANPPTAGEAQLQSLTERERHILELIARGWDNARIAAELQLAEQTVRNYASQLYAKLGLSSRSEAIIWARDQGMVEE